MAEIDLKELRIQIALGTVDDNIRAIIWQTDSIEALKMLSACDDLQIRKAVSINLFAPYSVLKRMMKDTDPIVRDCAYEQIARRYKRRFHQTAPDPPWKDPWNPEYSNLDDLPDDTLFYRD